MANTTLNPASLKHPLDQCCVYQPFLIRGTLNYVLSKLSIYGAALLRWLNRSSKNQEIIVICSTLASNQSTLVIRGAPFKITALDCPVTISIKVNNSKKIVRWKKSCFRIFFKNGIKTVTEDHPLNIQCALLENSFIYKLVPSIMFEIF